MLARKEIKKFQQAYSEFEYVYYIIISIIYSVSFIMIMPFIRIYTQEINDINYYLPTFGFVMVLNGLLYNIKTPQGMLVISAGLYRETRLQSTIQALIIIVFGCILAPKFGLNGIVIASCLSNLYRTIDLLYFVEKNITHISKITTIKRLIRMLINIVLVSCICIKLNIEVYTLTQWILSAIVITVIASTIIVISNLLLEKKQILNIYRRIRSII